jgi:hypothetical protein
MAAASLGQTFEPDPEDCEGVTVLQSGSPAGQYAAPVAGVITSWSFQAPGGAAPDVPELKFKVGRPAGANAFTIVGEEGPRTPAAGVLNSYPARISVQPGDVIGFALAADAAGGFCARAPAPGYTAHAVPGDVPPGNTVAFPVVVEGQLDVAAILEPDCDGDGLGDETQDPELPLGAACGKGNRVLTLDANKNKVKKRKKVTLSGRLTPTARQGQCESAQTVELQRKRPKQTTFTTFASVQTDAQGSFSLKKKVKKTFEYRAQVVETAACTAALSNTEKVKVKKKKKAAQEA